MATTTTTTSYVVQAMQLGFDLQNKPRSLFLYDGGCGVCKFTISIIAQYDKYDHIRYRPLQTTFIQKNNNTTSTTTTSSKEVNNTKEIVSADDKQMKELYQELGIPPFDLSTAVLLQGTNNKIYMKSNAILYCLYHMGFPFTILGMLLIYLIPIVLRDYGYTIFAQNRSAIWIYIKKLTGLPDTNLYKYRNKILLPTQYIDHPELIPSSWGLQDPLLKSSLPSSSSTTGNESNKNEESKKDS